MATVLFLTVKDKGQLIGKMLELSKDLLDLTGLLENQDHKALKEPLARTDLKESLELKEQMVTEAQKELMVTMVKMLITPG